MVRLLCPICNGARTCRVDTRRKLLGMDNMLISVNNLNSRSSPETIVITFCPPFVSPVMTI